MLRKIKIKNFYSIGAEQELDFFIADKDVLDASSEKLENREPINLVSCVVGANASGKTTLLKAFSFLAWFVENSYSSIKPDSNIGIEPHQLLKNQPTRFEIEFYEKAELFKYVLELNKKQVIEESLYKKGKRFAKVFTLKRNDKSNILKTEGFKISNNDRDRLLNRSNISFFSAIMDLGYLDRILFFKNIITNVNSLGFKGSMPFVDSFKISDVLLKDEKLQKEILHFSKAIDLGITAFQIQEIKWSKNESTDKETAHILRCIHSATNKNFSLPIFEESNGTQRSYSLLLEILPMLNTGGLVVIDEIEDGLHPEVVKKIISIFSSKETNPKNTQLFFATHQHVLLNDRTKTQIFITEKNNLSFETEVFRLDEIQGIRNDENYFSKYAAGVYGGTPSIKWI